MLQLYDYLKHTAFYHNPVPKPISKKLVNYTFTILSILVICMLAVAPAVAYGQSHPAAASRNLSETSEILSDSTEIHFRQSSSKLDFSLDNNKAQLEAFLNRIREITGQDSTFVVSTLRVIGSSSPEGTDQLNRQLSEQRAKMLFDYFAEHVTLPPYITDFEYLGRNWKGLYKLVLQDSSVPYRDEVLGLLKIADRQERLSVHESNHLLNRLKLLKSGEPYLYLYKHLFPALRYSYLYVEYEKRMHHEIKELTLQTIELEEAAQKETAAEETIVEAAEETTAEPIAAEETTTAASIYEPRQSKSLYMALKTNMLFDVAAVPNISAEFYVGKNLSVVANWMYSWWDSNPRHRYWRLYGGDLALRWWFGSKAHEKPLTGHHLGIYGGAVTFDFEWGGTGYMGGTPGGTLWDRCLINGGIEYGYSLPIARRLNIDFTIGIGYLGGKYIKYFPFDNEYFWDKEFKMHFIGPTKAEISLVWLIGPDNKNKRKGGGE